MGARQRGPVITFLRRVPVVLASIRGIAALISGLDVFPRVLPAVIIPGGFWMLLVFGFMLLIRLC